MQRHWRVTLLLMMTALFATFRDVESAPALRFTEFLIADGYGYAFGLAAADLDGDGDLDLTSCDTVNNALYWFENDGKGMFRRRAIQRHETGWFERHAIGDINGDKRPDVVVVKNLDGHVVWFENSGRPARDESWKRHVISTDLKRAYDVAVVDLNSDGLLDVAASVWTGNHLAWFANPGKQAVGEWTKQFIDRDIAETRAIRTADFNGDGRPDLFSTARGSNLTAWYQQSNKPGDSAWTRHVIDDRSPQPIHGHPVDMDGDGDADVVMALGMLAAEDQAGTHQIAWYENVGRPGTGMEWKKHVVGSLPFAFEAVAGDLDKDGDVDVVGTAWGGSGQVAWFENSGAANTTWTKHVLKETWNRANQAIIADLDGDGRPDIAATAERGANELRWWRNSGNQ